MVAASVQVGGVLWAGMTSQGKGSPCWMSVTADACESASESGVA
jgi:hypothetical protein